MLFSNCVDVAAVLVRNVLLARLLSVTEFGLAAYLFSADAARIWRVAAALRSAGRKPAARAYDAFIAATAIANRLPLYTANPADFVGIAELDVRTVVRAEPGGDAPE